MSQSPCVLVCSAVGVGHYTPATAFGASLARHCPGLQVICVSPVRPAEDSSCKALRSDVPNLRQIRLVLPAEGTHPVTMSGMVTHKEWIVERIQEELGEKKVQVRAVIHDLFAVYAPLAVERLFNDCPTYLFNPSHLGASLLMMGGLISLLMDRVRYLKAEDFPEIDLLTAVVPSFGFNHHDEPVLKCPGDICGKNIKGFIVNQSSAMFPSMGGFVEKFYPAFLTGLRAKYPGAPMVAENFRVFDVAEAISVVRKQPTTAVDQNRVDILDWIKEPDAKPVVVISFGTLYTPPGEVLRELIDAILPTKSCRVLWVHRKRAAQVYEEIHDWTIDVKEVFDREVDDCQHRVVEWAPLLEVLDEPQVSLLITHGGWNTLMENICMTRKGCPVVVTPLGSDQFANAVICEKVLKIGRSGLITNTERLKQYVKDDFRAITPESFAVTTVQWSEEILASMNGTSEVFKKFHEDFSQSIVRSAFRFLNASEWRRILEEDPFEDAGRKEQMRNLLEIKGRFNDVDGKIQMDDLYEHLLS